jgi:hypothetical protein
MIPGTFVTSKILNSTGTVASTALRAEPVLSG